MAEKLTPRVHFIEEGHFTARISTPCGLEAWREAGTEDEFSTALGGRLCATQNARFVTCKRCRRRLTPSGRAVLEGER